MKTRGERLKVVKSVHKDVAHLLTNNSRLFLSDYFPSRMMGPIPTFLSSSGCFTLMPAVIRTKTEEALSLLVAASDHPGAREGATRATAPSRSGQGDRNLIAQCQGCPSA